MEPQPKKKAKVDLTEDVREDADENEEAPAEVTRTRRPPIQEDLVVTSLASQFKEGLQKNEHKNEEMQKERHQQRDGTRPATAVPIDSLSNLESQWFLD